MSQGRSRAAPAHLSPATRAWWRSVVNEYELAEHHRRVLLTAAECWDRSQDARRILAEKGLTYTDRFGTPKARPEVQIERDAKIGFLRALRELGLDVGGPDDSPRPPALPGIAGGASAPAARSR